MQVNTFLHVHQLINRLKLDTTVVWENFEINDSIYLIARNKLNHFDGIWFMHWDADKEAKIDLSTHYWSLINRIWSKVKTEFTENHWTFQWLHMAGQFWILNAKKSLQWASSSVWIVNQFVCMNYMAREQKNR